MRLIVYTNPRDNSASQLQDEIPKIASLNVEFIHTQENFMRSLRSHMVFQSVVVFQATDQADFLFLESIRNLLFDARLILILPDREKDTIKKGFSLYPRYIAYSDDGYKDVAAVLKKMHLNYNLKGNR
jgi:hypothetical protein